MVKITIPIKYVLNAIIDFVGRLPNSHGINFSYYGVITSIFELDSSIHHLADSQPWNNQLISMNLKLCNSRYPNEPEVSFSKSGLLLLTVAIINTNILNKIYHMGKYKNIYKKYTPPFMYNPPPFKFVCLFVVV